MKRDAFVAVLIVSLLVALHLFIDNVNGSAGKDKTLLRVGVYDSRAVTIAYSASKHNDNIMVAKSKAKKKAEQAGDLEKAETIDRWMFHFSVKRHSQGFATAPVGDLLKCIEKQLPKIANDTSVDMIVSKWQPDYLAKDAEVIDITPQIVAAYKPSEKTLATIKRMSEIKPITEADILEHELAGGH